MKVDSWDKGEQILADWRAAVKTNQINYYDEALRFRRIYYILGACSTVLPVILAAILFLPAHHGMPVLLRLALAIGSMFAAILASLQTFFRFGERADQFRRTGVRLGRIAREIDHLIALPKDERPDLDGVLRLLRAKTDNIAEDAPQLRNMGKFELAVPED